MKILPTAALSIAAGLFLLPAERAAGEIVLLTSGEKLRGDIVIPYKKGILFREEEGAPGRYYTYEEVRRIMTADGLLFYLMPRGQKREVKKRGLRFFPFARPLLSRERSVAPTPHISLPGGEAVEVMLSGAEDAVTLTCEEGPKIRLLGLRPPIEAAGGKVLEKARNYLSGMAEGKKALLFSGPQDAAGAPFPEAYVVIDGVFLNADLIEKGWARASETTSGHPYTRSFKSLERYARNLNRGAWSGVTE